MNHFFMAGAIALPGEGDGREGGLQLQAEGGAGQVAQETGGGDTLPTRGQVPVPYSCSGNRRHSSYRGPGTLVIS